MDKDEVASWKMPVMPVTGGDLDAKAWFSVSGLVDGSSRGDGSVGSWISTTQLDLPEVECASLLYTDVASRSEISLNYEYCESTPFCCQLKTYARARRKRITSGDKNLR